MIAKRIRFGTAGALLAMLSLLLLVAACGGDDNGDDADPTATEAAAEDPAATEPVDEPDPAATEPAAAESSVDVSLSEFAVEPSAASVPAGAVTFNVTSDGAIPHNLRVVSTDLAPDELPLDDAGAAVDEDQVTVVGSIADLNAGDSEELTEDLAAGNYVLICNVPGHYASGMTVAFTVE